MGARYENVTEAEEAVAAALIRARISYQYEPKQFNLHLVKRKEHSEILDDLANGISPLGFRPDFYLTDLETYLEVGGFRSKRHKLAMMRRCFPNVKVIVIDNSWTDPTTRAGAEFYRLRGGDMLQWLEEKWIEQEFFNVKHVERRVEARRLALEKSRRQVLPSMRTT